MKNINKSLRTAKSAYFLVLDMILSINPTDESLELANNI